MRITKQHKIEQYEILTRKNDLLSYYLWDMEAKRPADASTQSGEWHMRGYRLTGANGGYVVMKPTNGIPDVGFLDDLVRRYSTDSHPVSLDIRICIERMQVARNRAFDAKLSTK